MRVLKWIVDRANSQTVGVESPLGWMPRYEDIDWEGMEDFSPEKFEDLMSIEREDWVAEVLSHEELFFKLYDRLPKELIFIRELILSGLWRSPERWQFGGANGN
jgi:phosphoenolpyruvate carboxykinase (GTP)